METQRKQCSLCPTGLQPHEGKGHFIIPTVAAKKRLEADMPALFLCSPIILKTEIHPPNLSSVNSRRGGGKPSDHRAAGKNQVNDSWERAM